MAINNSGMGLHSMQIHCPGCGNPKPAGSGVGTCMSCQRQALRLESDEGRESSRVNSSGLKMPGARGF